MGFGLALAAFLLPGYAPKTERHSDEEILARLVAPEADLEHGPLFWLHEQGASTELYRQARGVCREGLHHFRPGCRMLATLEAFRAASVRSSASLPEASLPSSPPDTSTDLEEAP